MSSSSFNQGANMTAGSKGGFRGPDTRAPGGGGMDYNGNPIGGGMGAQFNFGGPPRPSIGFGPAPMPPQGGRFTPRGMIPPAGATPQPGQPTGSYTRQRFPQGDPRRYGNQRFAPEIGAPGNPQPFPAQPPSFGGGKGGFQGPGRPQIGMPVERPFNGIPTDNSQNVGYGVIDENDGNVY